MNVSEQDERLQKYVAGELADEEIADVERRIRENPALAGKAYRYALQHEDLRELYAKARDSADEATPTAGGGGALAMFRRLVVPLAVAAAVVAGVGIWWTWKGPKGQESGWEGGVARVESAMGDVWVRNEAGVTRDMAKGTGIRTGETVLTGTNGEVLLTWEDGTRVTVRCDTEIGLSGQDRQFPSAEWRKTLKLKKGAIVASAAKQPTDRPLTVETPQARCTVVGTKFFLMVASGLTTKGAPWSFTRLDVTEGSAKFRPSSVSDLKSEIPVVARQAVCAGTDHEGKTIRTVARKSDGRELSPKYGGIFYKDCADFYDTRKSWILESNEVRIGGVLRTISVAECARTGKTEGGMDVSLQNVARNGMTVEVLGLAARNANQEGMFAVPLPDDMPRSFCVEFDSWLQKRVEGSVLLRKWHYGYKGLRGYDPPSALHLAVPRRDNSRPMESALNKWHEVNLLLLRVGDTADGAPLWELRVVIGAEHSRIYWMSLPVEGVRIGLLNLSVEIGELRIRELSSSFGPTRGE